MKQFSTVLNIILLLAVSMLFYLHFSSKSVKSKGLQAGAKMHTDSSNCSKLLIAYVELDSLNNNITFIKDRKRELEAEQNAIANEYESAYRNMEADKNNFLKKGDAITQQEAETFQAKLIQRQQDVEATKQNKAQKLAERGAKIMEDMQAKLKEFINDYNADKKYTYIMATGSGMDLLFYKDSTLNITPDVIKGMNEKMKSPGK
jgi:outer membrane protein